MKAPFVRSAYNYDADEVSLETGLSCPEPPLTQQQFADECDINCIMERFGFGAMMPDNVRIPTYGDFTGISDYHTAVNAVARAGEAFDALPAAVRARFNHSPGMFVDFCSQPGNERELERLGLLPPSPPPSSAGGPPAAAGGAASPGGAAKPQEGAPPPGG